MRASYELNPPLVPAPAPAPAGTWAKLVELYGTADPRSLGLFRVLLGALLTVDVLFKVPEVEAHLSNTGWLTNHFALFRPMSEHLFSVYFAFGSPREVMVLLGLHLVVCLLLMVGYRTKLMQVLAFVLTTSLNSRNILIENGGGVVLNLLLAWSMFLPLGRRFSVDALRRSLCERRETTSAALNERGDPAPDLKPVVSLAVTALILQWATIYFFNTIQKNGAPWRDGSAVYYFLQQERLLTWFGAWLRDSMPLGVLKGLTFVTLLIEGSVPLLLLSPWRPHLTRSWALGLITALHLSIDSVLQLGAFSWAMPLGVIALLPRQAWDAARRYWAKRRTPSVVHFDPEVGGYLALCRAIKRFDTLGLVTFRAIDEASPKKAAKGLCVSVRGETSVGGWEALLAVADSLWFGRRPLQLLAPFARRRFARFSARLASAPRELDVDWGLDLLPREADERAPEPSEARRLCSRIIGSLREGVVVVLLLACATQVLFENAAVPAGLKPRHRPALFTALIEYPRLFQGWSMFGPAPPQSDARLVIDGRTRDGRHLDPLTGRAPVFEVQPPGAPRMNLIWGYFHLRIGQDHFRAYWNGVRDFVLAHHKLTGRPEDELASFQAYWVTQAFPPPGAKRPPAERRLLFSNDFVPPEPPAPAAAARPKGTPRPARAQ